MKRGFSTVSAHQDFLQFERIIAHQKTFEKFYFCPAGYPTIGYGHVVKPHEDFSAGIDAIQAEELLR